MDLFVIICKVNVNCFVLDKWLACFVISNVNIAMDASLGSCGRMLHFLQDNWLSINTHPTRCETVILYFCESVPELKMVIW